MADTTTTDWRRTIRRRALIAGLCLAAWSAAIEARLVYLQVVRHADLMARADRQQNRVVEAPAKRGEIRDRNNRLLAYSVDVDSVYAVPSEIRDARAAALALCRRARPLRRRRPHVLSKSASGARPAPSPTCSASCRRRRPRGWPRSTSKASAS